MGLRMGRNLKNKKKLMMIRMMNNAGLNDKNIMNSVGTFNDRSVNNSN